MTVHGDKHQLEYLVKKQLLTSLKCSLVIVLPHFYGHAIRSDSPA